MHGKIAVGGLPDVERAVPQHDGVRGEQHKADRQHNAARDEKRNFRFPGRLNHRVFARKDEPSGAYAAGKQETQQLRGQIEPHRKGKQRREPNQHSHAERESEPDAYERLFTVK